MTTDEAIATIINHNEEIRAIKILTNSLENYVSMIERENRHMDACLRAIKKINRGKDEAIEALCDKEG